MDVYQPFEWCYFKKIKLVQVATQLGDCHDSCFGPNTQITKYFESPIWFQTGSKRSNLCVLWTKSWHVWTDCHFTQVLFLLWFLCIIPKSTQFLFFFPYLIIMVVTNDPYGGYPLTSVHTLLMIIHQHLNIICKKGV